MAGATAQTFDFVVVGGGTAGCALAARLSESPTHTVCLLEAGGRDRHPFIVIPATVQAALNRPSLNWSFQTVPQPGLHGRRIPVPRGRVLGGSGSVNGMAYHRGHPRDYDDWARAGATGWSYDEVLPYFIRSENNENYPPSRYHGRGGPMNICTPERPNPMTRDFITAARQLGFPECRDFTGPPSEAEGVGIRQAVIRNGRRESTASAFLRPALRRSNLVVMTRARARRVLFSGRRAVGVELVRGGETYQVIARQEIALCLGALQTPQLLMCSGVGDGASLAHLGIDVVKHLPGVGCNLQDHLAAPVRMITHDSTSYGLSWRALPRGLSNAMEYLFTRRGPLAANVFEAAAFLRVDPAADRPDFQFVFQPWKPPTSRIPVPIGHGYGISPVLLYPKSRGRLSLESADPFADPLIDPKLLSDPDDLPRMIDAVRLCRRMLAAPAFERYSGVETLPGPRVQSTEELAEFIRETAYTVHHPVGTCRMGSDPAAVLDPTLAVRGVESLRVADASVFPSILGGNTNAPVVMVAEKAADLMLGRPPPATAPLERTSADPVTA
jgi:choline dehydrogenase-like flavoprotein